MENEISYREQTLRWEQNMHALRKKYRNTPVGYRNGEQEILEEERLKNFAERLEESRKVKLMNPPLSEERMFAGRRKELMQIEETLQREHRVLLYGIGGIGKSSLARFYGYEKQKQGVRVLLLTCQHNLLEMIVSDAQLTISGYTYNARLYRSKKSYFRAKMDALRKLAEEGKLLLIVDDFNLEKDNCLKEVLELPCDMIFTGRVVPQEFSESCRILLHGIAEEEWQEFLKLYVKNDFPEERFLQKGREVQNHPLFMKLYLFMLHEKKSAGDKENRVVGWELLKPLRGLKLKKREKLFLLWMSLLPSEGIEKEIFCLICEIVEGEPERLLRWNLLEEVPRIEGRNQFRIHPVIAAEIRKQISPSYENCRFFLERFCGYLGGELDGIETWNRSYEENARLVEPVLCLTRQFRDPPIRMLMKYDEFATLLWVQGYFSEAEKITLRSFRKAEKSCGLGNKLTAFLAGRVAAVYHNRSMHEKATVWYQKSLECFEQIPKEQVTAESARNHMDILTKLQRMAWQEGKYEEEEAYYRQALEVEDVRKTAPGQDEVLFGERCVQYVHMYHALSLGGCGRTKEGLALMQQCMEEPQIRESRYCLMEFRGNFARILFEHSRKLPKGCQEWEERLKLAEKIIREVVEASERYRGSQYYYTQLQREVLADILIACGRQEEGRSILEGILNVLQEYLPYDKEWIERILGKFVLST